MKKAWIVSILLAIALLLVAILVSAFLDTSYRIIFKSGGSVVCDEVRLEDTFTTCVVIEGIREYESVYPSDTVERIESFRVEK